MQLVTKAAQTSRRSFLIRSVACLASSRFLQGNPLAFGQSSVSDRVSAREHWIPRDGFKLFAQEYPGRGPALVLLHGFPDNLHIYDRLIPFLVQAGRHVIAFDFLGFGKSDKPTDYPYSFDQQQKDIEAVVESLNLGRTIPVAHDAGGVAGINYALAFPQKVAGLCLLNTFYGDTKTLRFPELIALFSDPDLKALSSQMLSDPKQMAFILNFQNQHFVANATPQERELFNSVLQPIINENFSQKPSAGPAFAKMTSGLREQVQLDNQHVKDVERLRVPTSIIWGQGDPYLNEGVARDFAQELQGSKLHLLEAGHWPQIDLPKQVSEYLLADLSS